MNVSNHIHLVLSWYFSRYLTYNADTIITAFPRRWGHNKPDSSGIHKSLRERLHHMDKEIMSVWHLGKFLYRI